MDYDKLFKFFIVDQEVETNSITGLLITKLSAAIEARGVPGGSWTVLPRHARCRG